MLVAVAVVHLVLLVQAVLVAVAQGQFKAVAQQRRVQQIKVQVVVVVAQQTAVMAVAVLSLLTLGKSPHRLQVHQVLAVLSTHLQVAEASPTNGTLCRNF
jgi:glycerol-3-phosphate O-acyltransferase